MAKRRFVTYKILVDALKRDSIEKPGTTATLLLECFVNLDGEVKAKYVESKGLCLNGGFKNWRESLISKGWLNYLIGSYSKHSPGAKLLKYVNKEKITTQELVTTKNLEEHGKKFVKQEDFEAVKEEVAHLKKVVTQMIEEFDPPATTEKIEKRLKVVKNQK